MIIVFNKLDGGGVMASLPLPAIYVLDGARILFPQADIKIHFDNQESAQSAMHFFQLRANATTDCNDYNSRFDFSTYQKQPELKKE